MKWTRKQRDLIEDLRDAIRHAEEHLDLLKDADESDVSHYLSETDGWLDAAAADLIDLRSLLDKSRRKKKR